jgi:hypothetical protein
MYNILSLEIPVWCSSNTIPREIIEIVERKVKCHLRKMSPAVKSGSLKGAGLWTDKKVPFFLGSFNILCCQFNSKITDCTN